MYEVFSYFEREADSTCQSRTLPKRKNVLKRPILRLEGYKILLARTTLQFVIRSALHQGLVVSVTLLAARMCCTVL